MIAVLLPCRPTYRVHLLDDRPGRGGQDTVNNITDLGKRERGSEGGKEGEREGGREGKWERGQVTLRKGREEEEGGGGGGER